MSDLFNQYGELSQRETQAKNHALISYGLMALGVFTGIFWLVGAIWAMVKKSDAVGTRYEDHYENMTKTFWGVLIFSIIGFLTSLIFIGYFILFATWIWSIYRLVKGIARILSDQPYN